MVGRVGLGDIKENVSDWICVALRDEMSNLSCDLCRGLGVFLQCLGD